MCPCFQKRSEQDNEAIIPSQDFVKWSIRLGFNGEINPAFENKYLNVMEVRKQLKRECIYAVIITTIFVCMYPFVKLENEFMNESAKILLVTFTAVSCFSILAHLKIIIEYTRHDKKMEKEHQDKVIINADSN